MALNKLENYEGRTDLGIYHHFTIAINTENIKMVFNDVKDMATDFHAIIIRAAL